jgi:hypothetical protein
LQLLHRLLHLHSENDTIKTTFKQSFYSTRSGEQ